MFKKHPEVTAAEETLSELRTKLETAEGDALADLQFRVTAQTKIVEELRWAHTPRPLATADNYQPIDGVADEQPFERAY